jgi:hypothetical protein
MCSRERGGPLTNFDLEDLGAKDLKGIAGPVQAWAALRPAVVESRFEALHATDRAREPCTVPAWPV